MNVVARARAFSMIELLSVVAVISALSALAVPAFRGTLDRVTLSGAAGLVEAEISLARQTAISRGLPVDFRIYQEDTDDGPRWRHVAVVIRTDASGSSQEEWVTNGKSLPGHIVFDDAEQFSTVISNAVPQTPSRTAPWSGQESQTAPSTLRNRPFVGFSFNADGSTNLTGSGSWCLTLRSPNSPRVSNQPAENFISLVLDPSTGSSILFQP